MQTKHNSVKQAIKSKILEGFLEPYQKISSENELMREFNVSRHTVRRALGDLVNEGWLYRKQGAGTFCANRSLKNRDEHGQQKNIAIITTYISDYIFPSIIRGAESYLSEQGYQVSLFSTNNNHASEKALLERVIEQHFDGVIIEPTQSAYPNPNINCFLNLEKLHIPYIMINAFYDELDSVNVLMDDEKGGCLQTEHLIELGHKEIIGMFKTDDRQGKQRMRGYIKAHRNSQLPINPQNVLTYSTDEKSNKPLEFLEEVLLSNRAEKPTAIVCYNDELAVSLLDVLRGKNLHVPEDMSIIGFDDSFLARVSEVKLTTVSHPQADFGKKAAGMIVELIQAGKGNESLLKLNSYVFDSELVLRSSTKERKKVLMSKLLLEDDSIDL